MTASARNADIQHMIGTRSEGFLFSFLLRLSEIGLIPPRRDIRRLLD
jgi:hypothetical protein